MTREEAIAKLVELDVAKWGEGERAAAKRLRSQLTHGLALNALAHYDLDAIDDALATEAQRVMTAADRRVLAAGRLT
jgi:hypothetical protein